METVTLSDSGGGEVGEQPRLQGSESDEFSALEDVLNDYYEAPAANDDGAEVDDDWPRYQRRPTPVVSDQPTSVQDEHVPDKVLSATADNHGDGIPAEALDLKALQAVDESLVADEPCEVSATYEGKGAESLFPDPVEPFIVVSSPSVSDPAGPTSGHSGDKSCSLPSVMLPDINSFPTPPPLSIASLRAAWQLQRRGALSVRVANRKSVLLIAARPTIRPSASGGIPASSLPEPHRKPVVRTPSSRRRARSSIRDSIHLTPAAAARHPIAHTPRAKSSSRARIPKIVIVEDLPPVPSLKSLLSVPMTASRAHLQPFPPRAINQSVPRRSSPLAHNQKTLRLPSILASSALPGPVQVPAQKPLKTTPSVAPLVLRPKARTQRPEPANSTQPSQSQSNSGSLPAKPTSMAEPRGASPRADPAVQPRKKPAETRHVAFSLPLSPHPPSPPARPFRPLADYLPRTPAFPALLDLILDDEHAQSLDSLRPTPTPSPSPKRHSSSESTSSSTSTSPSGSGSARSSSSSLMFASASLPSPSASPSHSPSRPMVAADDIFGGTVLFPESTPVIISGLKCLPSRIRAEGNLKGKENKVPQGPVSRSALPKETRSWLGKRKVGWSARPSDARGDTSPSTAGAKLGSTARQAAPTFPIRTPVRDGLLTVTSPPTPKSGGFSIGAKLKKMAVSGA